MPPVRLVLIALLVAAITSPATAQRGGFVETLGRDTTGLERFRFDGRRLEVEQVGRIPRVTSRRLTLDYDVRGTLQRFTIVRTSPDAAPGSAPLQRYDGTCTGDSIITVIRDGADVRTVRAAVPEGSPVIYPPGPWAEYDLTIQRFLKSRRDSIRSPFYRIGAGGPGWIRMRRLGLDSVEVSNHHEDVFRAAVDRDGRLVAVLPVSGPSMFSATRVADLDLNAIAAGWLALERAAGAAGALSTRDTVTVAAGGASLWIDYGRPAKRGRVVFGNVVPYGAVWRTGANAATQLRTDRALEFAGHTLLPGIYTLWTIPSADGWKLVVNSETGQWGTAHRAERDLFMVDMTVSDLPAAVERFTISVEPAEAGGTLHLDWDTTRASVTFRTVAD